MKVAKSYKIILLILAFVMSTMLALGMMKSPSAYAESSGVSAQDYFYAVGTSTLFTDKGLSIEAKGGSNVSFNNNLIVNDMSMKMMIPEGFTTTINIDLASFYTNGNPKEWSKNSAEGTEFDKIINNTLELKYLDGSTTVINAWLNGKEINAFTVDNEGFIVIEFGIENNYLTVNAQNVLAAYSADEQIYYKVKNIDDRAVTSKISLAFVTADNITGSFILEYVDQKTSDLEGNYKQTLKIEDGQTKPTSAKYMRAYLSEAFYLRKPDGSYDLVVRAWKKAYKMSYKPCSVFGDGVTLCLVNPNDVYDVYLETSTSTPDTIRFSKNSDGKFGVGAKKDGETLLFEEFEVDELKDPDYIDEQVPEYINDEIAYASFLNALKEEYTTKNSNDETTSVGLGTNINIPSMKDLVFDNFDTYESLSTKLYYKNQSEELNVSQMSFNLKKIGDYLFFVAFSDSSDNAMLEKDFITNKDQVVTNGKYGEDSSVANYVGNFVFRFEIEDNAEIIVKAPAVQGNGYKGVQYRASKFVINAEGCIKQYKLYYNANTNADADDAGWVEIPQTVNVDESYNENGYSYNELEEVNYDGELKFVPTRIGAYKIECVVTSSVSERSAKSSTLIKVESSPNPVEVPSKWLENNIWSVVFLSVGTLSLIGIIILLCIKPKDQDDKN